MAGVHASNVIQMRTFSVECSPLQLGHGRTLLEIRTAFYSIVLILRTSVTPEIFRNTQLYQASSTEVKKFQNFTITNQYAYFRQLIS